MNVQLVLIDRPRTSSSSVLEAALDLEEDSRAFAEMQIGMNHIALEKVAAVVLRTPTPTRIAEPLVLHARFAAYREIPILLITERNIFDSIQHIVAPGLVTQKTPVLFVPKLLV